MSYERTESSSTDDSSEDTFSRIKKTLSKIPKKISKLPKKFTSFRLNALQIKLLKDKLHSKNISDLFTYITASKRFSKNIKYNVCKLVELANNHYPRALDKEKEKIDGLLYEVYQFLQSPNDYDTANLLSKCKELDSPHCPYGLKVIIGIVLAIVAVALLLSAIALVISLTGGTAAAFIAPAVALAKPLIDIVAGISIASFTVGTPLATGALAGAGFVGAAATGGLSYFFMHKPYTDCVKEITKEFTITKTNMYRIK